MKSIKASEFKAKCLQLVSEVAETGDVSNYLLGGHHTCWTSGSWKFPRGRGLLFHTQSSKAHA